MTRNNRTKTLVGVLVGGIVLAVTINHYLKSTDAYRLAVDAANANPDVTRSIGTPFSTDFFSRGRAKLHVGYWEYFYRIGIQGPHGSGEILVEAQVRDGQLKFDVLTAFIENGIRIPLAAPKATQP